MVEYRIIRAKDGVDPDYIREVVADMRREAHWAKPDGWAHKAWEDHTGSLLRFAKLIENGLDGGAR